MARPRAWVLLLALALPPGAAWLFYTAGNGLTLPGVALATVPLGLVLGAVALRRPASWREARAALGLFAFFDLVYIAARLDRTQPLRWTSVRMCEEGQCGVSAPIVTRLSPEGETAMAGMALSSFFGLIREPETSELERLLRRDYGQMASDPAYRSLPNAPLLGVLRGDDRSLLWMPPESAHGPAPCIVFLHGFGGQLTAYLHALSSSELGQRFAILAPFGGPAGLWWRPGEQERLLRLLDRLPAGVDRERLYLVGLSNGAIGATVLATSPRFAGRFRKVVALSGAGWAGADPPSTSTPLLLLAGADDPRFPYAGVEERAAQLKGVGVPVQLESLPGDHFILLSKNRQVARRIAAWIDAR